MSTQPTYRVGELVMVSYEVVEPQRDGTKVVKHGLDLGTIGHVNKTVGGVLRYYLTQPDGSGVDWSMGFRGEEIKRA